MQCRPSDVRAAAVNVGEGQLFLVLSWWVGRPRRL